MAEDRGRQLPAPEQLEGLECPEVFDGVDVGEDTAVSGEVRKDRRALMATLVIGLAAFATPQEGSADSLVGGGQNVVAVWSDFQDAVANQEPDMEITLPVDQIFNIGLTNDDKIVVVGVNAGFEPDNFPLAFVLEVNEGGELEVSHSLVLPTAGSFEITPDNQVFVGGGGAIS